MPGFPVFGTGQPTVGGFDKCLEPILKKYGDEKNIFWVNLRTEPVVYVNGKPYTARDPERYDKSKIFCEIGFYRYCLSGSIITWTSPIRMP